MTSKEPISLQLLTNYVAGECTPEQRATVQLWMAGHPHRAQWLDDLRALWLGAARLAVSNPTVDPESIVEQVAARIGVDRSTRLGIPITTPVRAPHPARFHTQSTARRVWALLGGSLAILAVGAGLFTLRQRTHAGAATQTYQTRPGEFATVRLADGSTLTLAPATTVTVRANEAQVTGAAYFTIASRAAHPITVRTRNATVQVLGTRFVVRQYADESSSRVAVEEGRVVLQSLGPRTAPNTVHDAARHLARETRTVLSAQMLAQVTDSGVTVTSGVSTHGLVGWTRGTLVFDGTPLRDVVSELRRVYDADILVRDSTLATKVMSAEVAVNQRSLPQVLDAICFILGAHYTRDGNAFVLAPGRRGGELPGIPDQKQPHLQPEKIYGR